MAAANQSICACPFLSSTLRILQLQCDRRRDSLVDRYLDAIDRELSVSQSKTVDATALQTIYLGGGTPTHLSIAQLARTDRFDPATLFDCCRC